ncbi:MAG: DUF3465 domain-containing protein [Desulfofustis sp.]|nr:DUF3465 domain-containing protein [Desulfofustis sp.]
MKNKQKLIFVLLAILIIASFYEQGYFNFGTDSTTGDTAKLAAAYENRVSNLQVEGSGMVEKVLRDDVEGSRHQRIILRISDNQTVLIAHNIDLAPRIENISKGDRLEFFGEYEWNNKGGVIHWTHRDPATRHVDGWLKHKGRVYQ